MARIRRSFLPLLFVLLQFASAMSSDLSLDKHGDEEGATRFQSKQHPRKRRLVHSSGKSSKRQSIWFQGQYSHTSDSSSSSSSSRSATHAKPAAHNGFSSDEEQDTDTPTNAPTDSNVPTQVLSESPSLRPSPGPSSDPSRLPTAAPSISPSTIPSGNPSMIPSDQPTSSAAPSTSPSAAPSLSPSTIPSGNPTMIPSDQPTSSMAPSTSPSAVASSVPSSIPSNSPSVTDSDQPTSSSAPTPMPSISLSPSITPSLSPSVVPSGTPTSSPGPSIQPTVTLSDRPSAVASMMPTQEPSPQPSLQPSTPAPFETATPSQARLTQSIPVFTLEYQLFDFDNPTEADLVELEALTRAYLRDHVEGAISDNTVVLVDFFTTYTDQESDPDSLVVLVSFESTAYYDIDSPTTLPLSDLIQEVENAFTGEELERYLGLVQTLPNSNLFAGTIQLFLVDKLESESESSATVPILAGSATVLLSVFGLIAHRRQKKHSRREASKAFLGILAKDSITDCSTNEGLTEEHRTEMSESSENDTDPIDNCVWERYKSPECLSFGETAFLGEAQSLAPGSGGKGISLMQELRQRLTSQGEYGKSYNTKRNTKSSHEMEQGELEMGITSSTPDPEIQRKPSQKMQVMEDLKGTLEARNSGTQVNTTIRTQKIGSKCSGNHASNTSQRIPSNDVYGNLMAELREKLSSRTPSTHAGASSKVDVLGGR